MVKELLAVVLLTVASSAYAGHHHGGHHHGGGGYHHHGGHWDHGGYYGGYGGVGFGITIGPGIWVGSDYYGYPYTNYYDDYNYIYVYDSHGRLIRVVPR